MNSREKMELYRFNHYLNFINSTPLCFDYIIRMQIISTFNLKGNSHKGAGIYYVNILGGGLRMYYSNIFRDSKKI